MTSPLQPYKDPEANTVGLARLLAGARSFKDAGIANVQDTYRGQIQTDDGSIRSAIIKDLPPRQLVNEVFGAALGHRLSLPIPPAYLTIAQADAFKARCAPFADGNYYLFASLDMTTPSVAHLVLRQPDQSAALRQIVSALLETEGVGKFYAFDAWIANIDRHIGNMLVGGPGVVWLIDHGHSFTGPEWTPDDLQAEASYRNRLREWLTPSLHPTDQRRYAAEATEFAKRLRDTQVRSVGEKNKVSSLLESDDFSALLAFLAKRAPHVQRLAVEALGMVA